MKKGDFIKIFGISEITFKRDMKKLKGLAEFIGTQEIGGYYLTEKMKNKLKK